MDTRVFVTGATGRVGSVVVRELRAAGHAVVGRHRSTFARFAQIDVRASSAKTLEALGWHPTEPTLLEDLDTAAYFPSS